MTAASPSERGAEVGRRIGVGLMYGLWKPRVLGAWKVPATGPVILAVNHAHNVDGPMVMGVAPRPTHFLIKKEAFVGPLGTFLGAIGQVEVDRSTADRTAITRALSVLDEGESSGSSRKAPEGAATSPPCGPASRTSRCAAGRRSCRWRSWEARTSAVG